MRWAIKHKSGRTLFVTADEFISNNRRKMGWIVEGVKMTSREQFEASWLRRGGEESDLVRYPENHHEAGSGNVGGQYVVDDVQGHWQTWQSSRSAVEIELPNQFPGEYYLDRDVIYADELIEELEQAGLKVKK